MAGIPASSRERESRFASPSTKMRKTRFESLRPETLLREHVTLRTNSVDDFHAYIAGMAGRIEREFHDDAPVDLELRHTRAGQIEIVVYFGNVDITAEMTRPVSAPFLVQFPLRGHFVARFPETEFEIHPGQAIVISPTQHVRRTSKPGCTLVFSVPSALLYARAELRSGKALEECLIFEPVIVPAVAEPLLEYALTVVDAVDRGVARPGDALSKVFENGFVDLLLELQPLADGPKPIRSEAQSRLERVGVVTAYIDANLENHLTVARLAHVAGCSVRALQATFAELCRISILGYVKQRRLAAARMRLESGSPVDSISTIALACGYSQFGRFSIDYRKAFGESPSETLARVHHSLGNATSRDMAKIQFRNVTTPESRS